MVVDLSKTEDDKKEEPASEDAGEGVQPKTISKADKAREITEREKILDREEALIEREEALEKRRAVSGRAEAGQVPKVETEDEKWEKDAKKRYEGTGMDPTPDDSVTEFK